MHWKWFETRKIIDFTVDIVFNGMRDMPLANLYIELTLDNRSLSSLLCFWSLGDAISDVK